MDDFTAVPLRTPPEFQKFIAGSSADQLVLPLQGRKMNIKSKYAAVVEMKCSRVQRAELVFNRVHLLHGKKRNNDQRILAIRAEGMHVGAHNRNKLAYVLRFTFQFSIEDVEHGHGAIHTVNGDALLCNWKEHASGAAGQLQNRTAVLLRQLDIKNLIGAIGFEEIKVVVILRGDVVRANAGGHGGNIPHRDCENIDSLPSALNGRVAKSQAGTFTTCNARNRSVWPRHQLGSAL